MDTGAHLSTAVLHFEADPCRAGKVIRSLMESRPEEFRRAAVELLADYEHTPGCIYLVTLLARAGVLADSLLDSTSFGTHNLAGALKVAQRAQPLLLSHVVDLLIEFPPHYALEEERRICQGIRLVDAYPIGQSVLPALRRLLDSSNERLRSKAALLLGRVTTPPEFPCTLLEDHDSRVRANAVEGFWPLSSPDVVAAFRLAASDSSARVVANAFVGLSLAGVAGAAGGIETMSRESSEGHRTSAAWAMGRTGDRQFLPRLKALSEDASALVRSHAIGAAVRIGNTV